MRRVVRKGLMHCQAATAAAVLVAEVTAASRCDCVVFRKSNVVDLTKVTEGDDAA